MTIATKKLNVVFHGMFAFVAWPDRMEVLAPTEEDHVYKAGAWGRERRLSEGIVYSLQGVVPGESKPVMDRAQNLVLSRLTQIERNTGVLFCSFTMPLPESMTGLRRVKPDPSRRLFGGGSSQDLNPASLPLIQVLTYEVNDELALAPLSFWSPQPDAQGFANLHIWAESDSVFTETERDHPIRGFAQLTRLFPGLDLQLLYSTGASMDASAKVPGMHTWEQATLRERSNLIFGGPVSNGGERGAEITNCLSMLVDNSD